MREILRQMAKARMKAMGVDHVNKRMKDFWRDALADPEAERTLMAQGRRLKAQRRRGRE